MAAKLDLAAFLPYQLSVASNAVSDQIARHYQARFGLKIPEWRLIAVLGEGAALTQRDLVAATRMDKVTVSRATAALVARGVIIRAANTTDRRSHMVTLTGAGAALYDDIAPVALDMEHSIMSCLDDRERATLCQLLLRLRDRADAMQHRPAADGLDNR